MKIDIMLDEGAIMPTKAHEHDMGFDLYANIPQWSGRTDTVTIPRKGCDHVETGVHISIPKGYGAFVKPRSGLAFRHELDTGAGVIDSGFTGEIKLCLFNHSYEDYEINHGDRVAQLVILPVPQVEFNQVDSLDEADRGDNGFGSSGK